MTTATIAICPVCGDEFTPPAWGNRTTCSPECGKQANRERQGIAIEPNITKGRTTPMTDEEFNELYHAIRAQRIRECLPLVDLTGLGAQEKQAREQAAERRAGR